MSDVDALLNAFEMGDLVRPSAEVLNTVYLANALAFAADAGPVDPTDGASKIAGLVGPTDHLVFVVADGLGMNLVEGMGRDAFIPRHVAAELRAVFPSTTAAALTSMATGLWPGEHTVLGWDVFLPEISAVATTLPFVRRSDTADLTSLGLTAESVFHADPLFSRMGRDVVTVMPGPGQGQRVLRLLGRQ